MNISFGRFKGSKISVVSGAMARPFTGMIKNSIFNMLLYSLDFNEAIIADVFCGSGIAGLESISLGAKRVYFIDNEVKSIKKNINSLSAQKGGKEFLSGKYNIISKKALKAFNYIDDKLDIIFMDPPFPLKITNEYYYAASRLLSEKGLIVIRFCKDNILLPENSNFSIIKEKKYGDSIVYILKKS